MGCNNSNWAFNNFFGELHRWSFDCQTLFFLPHPCFSFSQRTYLSAPRIFNFPVKRNTFCPWNWKRSIARIILVWFRLQTDDEADRLWGKSKSGQLLLFKSQRRIKKKLHRSFILTTRHNTERLCLFLPVGRRVLFAFLPSFGVSAVRSRWLCWYSWWWFPVERKKNNPEFISTCQVQVTRRTSDVSSDRSFALTLKGQFDQINPIKNIFPLSTLMVSKT